MGMTMKPVTYARIENGAIVEQRIGQRELLEGDWRPIEVRLQEYDRATHRDAGRRDTIEPDKVVREQVIEPIPVDAAMVKAECQRRIIAYTGGGDITGSLAKQINAGGAMQPEIDRLRAKSNEIEAMSPIPIDFRQDHYWT